MSEHPLDPELFVSRDRVLLMTWYLQGLVQGQTHEASGIYLRSERRLVNVVLLLFGPPMTVTAGKVRHIGARSRMYFSVAVPDTCSLHGQTTPL